MRTTRDGRGAINVLAADKLMMNPRLYATFLLWLMSELFEELPEVGDPDKPKLVFFFDEAHLLFDDAPKVAGRPGRAGGAPDPLEGRRRLFRHAEPARRARDACWRSSATACSMRCAPIRRASRRRCGRRPTRSGPIPDFDCAKAITQLGTGEALVSTLEDKGVPSMVQRTLIRPPASRLGPITPQERAAGDGARARSPASTTRRSTANRRSRCCRRRPPTRRAPSEQAQSATSSRSRPHALDAAGLRRLDEPRASAPAAATAARPPDRRRGRDQVGRRARSNRQTVARWRAIKSVSPLGRLARSAGRWCAAFSAA